MWCSPVCFVPSPCCATQPFPLLPSNNLQLPRFQRRDVWICFWIVLCSLYLLTDLLVQRGCFPPGLWCRTSLLRSLFWYWSDSGKSNFLGTVGRRNSLPEGRHIALRKKEELFFFFQEGKNSSNVLIRVAAFWGLSFNRFGIYWWGSKSLTAEVVMVWECLRSSHESPFLLKALCCSVKFRPQRRLHVPYLLYGFSSSHFPPFSFFPSHSFTVCPSPAPSCLAKRPKMWLISDLLIMGKTKPSVNGMTWNWFPEF